MAIRVLNGFVYGVSQHTIAAGEGLTAPRVSSAVATAHDIVRVTFNADMLTGIGFDPLSVLDPRAYSIVESGSGDPVAVIRVDQVNANEYDLTTESLTDINYDLTVDPTNVRDLEGTLLDGAFNTASFVGTAFDYGTTPGDLYTFMGVNAGLQDEQQASGWQPSQAFERRNDDTVTAVDTLPEQAGDLITRRFLPAYEPVIDLNMVEARLTNRARYYIARGMHDGTALHPTRCVLGTGWEAPRWGEPPKPSPDATEVTNAVFEVDVQVEVANYKTLVVRCEGPVEPDYEVQEVMVYAQILNSPVTGESLREIPFANATFPTWFHTVGQRFVARLVIPM